MDKLRIALLGFGTVGSGVYDLIQNNKYLNSQVEVVKILVRDKNKDRGINPLLFTTDRNDIFDVDIIIEAIGGLDLYSIYQEAFSKGIDIITANKELVNHYFYQLNSLAQKNKARFLFEATTLAGVLIIQALASVVRCDEVLDIKGILNGSTNYCLSKIYLDGYSFEQSLAEAKSLGFLEADPRDDLEGLDALRKLMILSKIIYGIDEDDTNIYCKSINGVSDEFIAYTKKGYLLKFLAQAKIRNGLVISVEPVLVKKNHPFANINYEENCIEIETKSRGKLMWTGKGAGKYPTAQGIISDLALLLENREYSFKQINNNLEIKDDQDKHYYVIDCDLELPFTKSKDKNIIMTKKITRKELKPYIQNIRFYAKVIK